MFSLLLKLFVGLLAIFTAVDQLSNLVGHPWYLGLPFAEEIRLLGAQWAQRALAIWLPHRFPAPPPLPGPCFPPGLNLSESFPLTVVPVPAPLQDPLCLLALGRWLRCAEAVLRSLWRDAALAVRGSNPGLDPAALLYTAFWEILLLAAVLWTADSLLSCVFKGWSAVRSVAASLSASKTRRTWRDKMLRRIRLVCILVILSCTWLLYHSRAQPPLPIHMRLQSSLYLPESDPLSGDGRLALVPAAAPQSTDPLLALARWLRSAGALLASFLRTAVLGVLPDTKTIPALLYPACWLLLMAVGLWTANMILSCVFKGQSAVCSATPSLSASNPCRTRPPKSRRTWTPTPRRT